MMLANGASMASVCDTDHVPQLLCTAHFQSLHLQEEGFGPALHPLPHPLHFTQFHTSQESWRFHPALVPDPKVFQTSFCLV